MSELIIAKFGMVNLMEANTRYKIFNINNNFKIFYINVFKLISNNFINIFLLIYHKILLEFSIGVH